MTVRVNRRFASSPEWVFDAWLDPTRARQFLFTKPSQIIVHAEIEARVGGSYLFVARRDGKDVDHVGKYLEIQRPHRLVFTLCVPAVWSGDQLVTVEIVPSGGGCELTLTHEGVWAQHEPAIVNGWSIFLEGLNALRQSEIAV